MTMTMVTATALFDSLRAPSADTPSGRHTARVTALPLTTALPESARRLILCSFNTLVSIIYHGKVFRDNCGVNLWIRDARWAWFTLNRADDQLLITYDLPENPRPIRRITSEVRSQTPNRQLCRLSIQTRTGLRTLLYFTLEPRQ